MNEKWKSLFRYELLVVILWICIEVAKSWRLSQIKSHLSADERQVLSDSKFRHLSTMVLVGAMVGVFLFWLLTQIWFTDTAESTTVTTPSSFSHFQSPFDITKMQSY